MIKYVNESLYEWREQSNINEGIVKKLFAKMLNKWNKLTKLTPEEQAAWDSWFGKMPEIAQKAVYAFVDHSAQSLAKSGIKVNVNDLPVPKPATIAGKKYMELYFWPSDGKPVDNNTLKTALENLLNYYKAFKPADEVAKEQQEDQQGQQGQQPVAKQPAQTQQQTQATAQNSSVKIYYNTKKRLFEADPATTTTSSTQGQPAAKQPAQSTQGQQQNPSVAANQPKQQVTPEQQLPQDLKSLLKTSAIEGAIIDGRGIVIRWPI